MAQRPDTGDDADVLIVGYGPVGSTLAVLLAQQGWRVTVLERRPAPYRLPRATSFDGETARLLAGTGIGPDIGRISEPATGYQWRNAAGRVLLDIAFSDRGRYGWPDANTMHQPALEELLAARAAGLPNLTVLRGLEVVRLTERRSAVEDGGLAPVEVAAVDEDGTERRWTARWLVGCDGANSAVREHLDVPVTDLDYSFEWLLCDVELREPREFTPSNVQVCDPARPTTLVASGPGHRRWEFMRLPGESVAELNRPETAWRLLAPFDVTPDTAKLLRSTTYMFQARWADRWRVGRMLLAGDAAHLMPPFAGQGMCSGVRDAVNLAWKLDLVLRGSAPGELLDSYETERREQAKQAILGSVQLGRLICVTDPAAAAERDATVLAGQSGRSGPRGPEPARPLAGGLLAAGSALAGTVVPQARVRTAGGEGLFDDVVGRGFVLLAAGDAASGLDEERRKAFAALGGRVVRVLPADNASDAGLAGLAALAGGGDPGGCLDVFDLDDVYLPSLAAAGATVALVRPDYHVFGGSGAPDGAARLVDALVAGLGGAAGDRITSPGTSEQGSPCTDISGWSS